MLHHFTLHISPKKEPQLFIEELWRILEREDFPIPNVKYDAHSLALTWLYRLHINLMAWNMSHHIMQHFFSENMIEFVALLNKYHSGIFYSTSQQLYEVLRFGCVQNICGWHEEPLSEQNLQLSDETAYLRGVRRHMEKTLVFCKRLKENPKNLRCYDIDMLYKKYHELQAFCLALDELDNPDVSDAKAFLMECCARVGGTPEPREAP